jgi:integrase
MMAQAWAMEKELEIVAVSRGQIPKKTFGQACVRYGQEVSPTKRGVVAELQRLKKFIKSNLARILLGDLSPAHLSAWRDARLREVSGPTVRRELNLMRSVLEICRREWRWIADNPLRDVRSPPRRPPRRRGASQAEIDRVARGLGYMPDAPVTTARQQVAVAFLFSIETAMRQGEILSLTPERIHLEKRYVELIETKNGDRREVPLSRRAVELLEQIMTDGRVFTVTAKAVGMYFRDARKAAGCNDLHFHDARSEALTRLSTKLDVLALARMVGHRDPRSLMIYYNASASELAARLD